MNLVGFIISGLFFSYHICRSMFFGVVKNCDLHEKYIAYDINHIMHDKHLLNLSVNYHRLIIIIMHI